MRIHLGMTLAALWATTLAAAPPPPTPTGAIVHTDDAVYGDTLNPIFEDAPVLDDHGDDVTAPHSLAWRGPNPSPNSGSKAIRATLQNGNAIYFRLKRHDGASRRDRLLTSWYSHLDFWVSGGPAGGQLVRVEFVLGSDNFFGETYEETRVGGTVDPDGLLASAPLPKSKWKHVRIDLRALGLDGVMIRGLRFVDASGHDQAPVYLDDLRITRDAPPPSAVVDGPALAIDAGAGRHPISDDIYGVNNTFLDGQFSLQEDDLRNMGVTVTRMGGDGRYNWKISGTNLALNYFFENVGNDSWYDGTPFADIPLDPAGLPENSGSDQFVARSQAAGTRSILQMPMQGWTARSRSTGDCAFSQSRYGYIARESDPYNADCGDGVIDDGACDPHGDPPCALVTGNDPRDTSVSYVQTFDRDWIVHLLDRATRGLGRPTFYGLDNEPDLWSRTYRDVQPQPLDAATYAGAAGGTGIAQRFAAAIRAADPSAKLLGPSLSGAHGYVFSSRDQGLDSGTFPGGPDDYPDYKSVQGRLDFTSWFLERMRAYERKHGVRLLDYLDEHYYPGPRAQPAGPRSGGIGACYAEALDIALTTAGTPALQAMRLRSTRALWDPGYVDETCRLQDLDHSTSEPIPPELQGRYQLIPLMKSRIAAHYPGTRTAITEYNFGGAEHMVGALAQTEALGVFGREGLDLACLFEGNAADRPISYAFRMFRNYDGQGHRFGDVSVKAASAGAGRLSIFAAQRRKDGAITAIVVNKDPDLDMRADIALAGFAPGGSLSVYRYSAEDPLHIVRQPDVPAAAPLTGMIFPRYSVTLLVIPSS